MKKKNYIKPSCEVVRIDMQSSFLVNSIEVDNTPQDGIIGRANINQRFTDIWGNEQ